MEDPSLLHALDLDDVPMDVFLDGLVAPDDVGNCMLDELAGSAENHDWQDGLLAVGESMLDTLGDEPTAVIESPKHRTGRGGYRHGIRGGKRNLERASGQNINQSMH